MIVQAKLRNIGPKSAAWLRQVGLRTREDLAEAGTVEAYMRVRRAGFKPGLNLLYAIEGALNDCHWQQVPEPRGGSCAIAASAARAACCRPGDHDDDVGAGRRAVGAHPGATRLVYNRRRFVVTSRPSADRLKREAGDAAQTVIPALPPQR